jgi:peptidyl-prolyl cis-trans isomerase SurA
MAATLVATLATGHAEAQQPAQAPAQAPAAPQPQAPGQGTIIQKIIVKVNGEIFTQSELEFRQIQALRQRDPQMQEAADLNSARLRGLLAEVTPELLVEAVDELLLVQHGRELGFSLTEQQFREAVDRLKADNNLDDDGLRKALAQEDMTLEDYRQLLERQFIIGQVQNREIMPQMTLTEAEARQYYAAHPDDFTTPATVTLREIFVAVPTETRGGEPVVNVAQDDAARAKVEAARARLVAGEDAAAIVAEVSESASKSNGGLVGPVDLAQLDPAIAEALSALEAGQVTQPIRTTRGYTLFTVESRTAPERRPFEDVHEDIRRRIYTERMNAETSKFLDRMRTLALIEWKDEEYRRMYDEALASRAPAETPAS